MICPLCEHHGAGFFAERTEAAFGRREYRRCPNCLLVFVPAAYHLSLPEERAHYDQHENDPADERYLAFLDRLAGPLAERLPEGASGLDFGCGPGPAMDRLFHPKGFELAYYDPFYAPDEMLLTRSWDFITASEVIEHLRAPRESFRQLDRLLVPGGVLGVMTEFLTDQDFGEWWYPRDPTHINFYAPDTLRWIAHWLGHDLEIPGPGVALLAKRAE